MDDSMAHFIDVLHAIRFERLIGDSGAETWARTDRLISWMVAAERNRTQGAKSLYAHLAERILEAEANWTPETRRTYCGSMSVPIETK